MNVKANRNLILLGIAVFVGIGLRMWVMSLGSGFDFESYCIVGQLVNEGNNVYAGTTRYNYGPLFFLIQGLCYTFAKILATDMLLTYRVLLVLVFTLADLGIMYYISYKKSVGLGILFFLNPVSIIITGYHNQFDNIAILLILLSVFFYNEEERISKQDVFFILFVALSLTMKHVLFLLPVWMFLRPTLCWKKRFIYCIVPMALFGMSFLPFMNSTEAIKGIIYNVFLYRSWMHGAVWEYLGIPLKLYFPLFVLFMLILGFLIRRKDYESQLMFYLIGQVAFASAAAPQYLVIPLVSLFVLDNKYWKYVYIFMAGLYLFVGEFSIADRIDNGIISGLCEKVHLHGYALASVVLIAMLVIRLSVMYKKESPKNL